MRLQLQGLRNLRPKIIKLRNDIDNLTQDLAKMQDLKNRQTKDKQPKELLKTKEIISEDQIPLLVQLVSETAHKHKVKIMQINTATETKVQEEIIAGEKLLPIVLKVDLSATYHSLGSFINDIEKTRQFVEVQDMKITRNPNDNFLENVNLVLKTYAKK